MTASPRHGEAAPLAGIDLFEAMYTTRAMRRLKPDPVPPDVLRAVLDAAIRAPSGGNAQSWSFVVVQDAEVRAKVAEICRPVLEALFRPGGPYHAQTQSPDPAVAEPARKLAASVLYLAAHLHEAPIIIFACIRTGGRPTSLTTGSSIYPAVQNLMLAARAFGLGSTLTTVHRTREDEIRALLGIPPEIETAAMVPIGYPRGRWGIARRRPLEEVVFTDRWGQPFSP